MDFEQPRYLAYCELLCTIWCLLCVDYVPLCPSLFTGVHMIVCVPTPILILYAERERVTERE